MTKPVPIKQCVEAMQHKVGHSTMLWLRVNQQILYIISRKRSRQWMISQLMACAGRKRKNEPVCLMNFRIAARQLERGELTQVM